jgi:hypothetical protein
VAWQPDRQRELSDGDRVAAAALAGPRAAALTGTHVLTARARACGGRDAAEASPRRRGRWRSRGRRWSGPYGPLDRTTLPLSAVSAAARNRQHGGPGWHRRLRPCAGRGNALHTATDPRRRGGCQTGKYAPRVGVSRLGLGPQEAPAGAGERLLPCVAGPLCPLVCLRIPGQGEAHRDRWGLSTRPVSM